MKINFLSLFRFLLLVLILGSTACRRGKKNDAGAIDDSMYSDLPPISEFEEFPSEPLPEGRAGFDSMSMVDSSALAPIYFGFDSSSVAAGEMSKVNATVDSMLSDSSLGVILQGHSDERGSREYNLALGERRALAVRDILLSMGVSADRIQSLSYGEEMPAVEGFDENAWSLNRRVEFQLMR